MGLKEETGPGLQGIGGEEKIKQVLTTGLILKTPT